MPNSDKSQNLFGERKTEEKPLIKLSPSTQALLDDMDREIDWERAHRIAKLMKTPDK
ncbi:MAG: hypothetical protein J5590_01570 [Clostridia bacterium]|nr:hypothetical protein [Clostridia bacterium]